MIGLDKKRKLVEELLSHLDKAQGDDLGKFIEASKKPVVDVAAVKVEKPEGDMDAKVDELMGKENSPEEEMMESPKEEALESAEAAPDDQELSDDELAEMLKKYLGESA